MVDFREATKDDCDLYFNWTQEEGVRDFAFEKKPIIYEHHVQWFQRKISEPSCLLLVALDDGLPCGQIRFDLDGNVALISFSIGAAFRGKGYSKEFLTKGATLSRQKFGAGILVEGVVMERNIASMRAFIAAGYQEIEKFKRDDIACVRFRANS